jgi:hypothetical protein
LVCYSVHSFSECQEIVKHPNCPNSRWQGKKDAALQVAFLIID